ncbi:MAG TPA: phage major capsid protein [Terriglobales bacterium]|nr:phage major capsid protein [Terriglobales bacterium]
MPVDRNRLLAEADSLLHRSTFTREDSARVESLLALADASIDRTELRRGTLALHAEELGRPTPRAATDSRFLSYLREGFSALNLEEKRLIGPERARPIKAAEGVGSGAGGGYIVPASFADTFFTILKQVDELFELATLFPTPTGSPTAFPLVDDVANAASIVGESQGSTEVEPTYAPVTFNACPTWRSGMVRASVELVQDSHFPIESIVAQATAKRFARGVGAAFVTTLLASAGLGVTAAAQAAIASDEIFSLIDALDAAYLPGASFLMSHATYTALSKLKGAGSGNYSFPVTVDASGRPLLVGFPVHFSPSMPAIAAGAKTIAFGDHSRFIRREVRGSLQLKTYIERYAELGQIGWEGFLRIDGALSLSGANTPVVYLAMHA